MILRVLHFIIALLNIDKDTLFIYTKLFQYTYVGLWGVVGFSRKNVKEN